MAWGQAENGRKQAGMRATDGRRLEMRAGDDDRARMGMRG
uniref:Uncharacterized protein n=1 Tax=Arundo donax TaxID=35708 RepID=A0A0A8YEV5_ARUDO